MLGNLTEGTGETNPFAIQFQALAELCLDDIMTDNKGLQCFLLLLWQTSTRLRLGGRCRQLAGHRNLRRELGVTGRDGDAVDERTSYTSSSRL